MTTDLSICSSNNLTQSDLNQCVILLEKYFELPHLNEVQIENLHKARILWFLVKEKDNIIGIATLTPDKEDNLKNILVIPSYRNKGICTMMLKNIKKFYISNKNKLNVPSLTILKNKENTFSLQAFYEKNSYKIIKEDMYKIFMELSTN